MRSFQNALAATLLVFLSLFLWRIGYRDSDLAVLALIPMSAVICMGAWPLMLEPWRAKLRVALREDSTMGRILTGRLRAAFLTLVFTCTAVTVLAWRALDSSLDEVVALTCGFVLAATMFAKAQSTLLRHFHTPFARSIATSLTTWTVALPFTVILAYSTWSSVKMPGMLLDAGFLEAVTIGMDRLPERGGWIAAILSVPYGYEAAKLWIVVALRDYPIVGALFSLDTALIAFVLCRTAIVIAQFTDRHIWK